MTDWHKPTFERILVTNDDGISADGIQHLVKIAKELSDDVWVVAPLSEQSGSSHSLTLTKPMRILERGEQIFAVKGTPTDCVMLGVNYLLKDKKPTLVLSGVNRGANLGEDVTYSGTVAGAIEGVLAGIPAIAISQCLVPGDRKGNWDLVHEYLPSLIKRVVEKGWPKDVFLNINIPAVEVGQVKGVRVTHQGQRDFGGLKIEKREDMRGFPYYWFGLKRKQQDYDKGTDLHTVSHDYISITPMHVDLTHFETHARLKDDLDCAFE